MSDAEDDQSVLDVIGVDDDNDDNAGDAQFQDADMASPEDFLPLGSSDAKAAAAAPRSSRPGGDDFVSGHSFSQNIKAQLQARKRKRADDKQQAATAAASSSSSASKRSAPAMWAEEDFISLKEFAPGIDSKTGKPDTTSASGGSARKRRRTTSGRLSIGGELAGGAQPSESGSGEAAEGDQIEDWSGHPRARMPWVSREYTAENFTLRLHEELLDFCAYVSPSQEEHDRRLQLIERVRQVTSTLWPGSTVRVRVSKLPDS